MHIVWSCMHVLVAIDLGTGTAIFYVAPAKPFLLPSSMADRFQKLSWRHWHVPTFSMFLLPSHFFHLATENINMAVGTTLWMARMKATPQRWWNVNVKEGEILNNVSNNVTSPDLSISTLHMRKHVFISLLVQVWSTTHYHQRHPLGACQNQTSRPHPNLLNKNLQFNKIPRYVHIGEILV